MQKLSNFIFKSKTKLNQNDWIPSKLVKHKKKVIKVKIGFVEINFIVGDRGELRLIENPEHADTIIQMSFDAFFKTIILKEKKGSNKILKAS